MAAYLAAAMISHDHGHIMESDPIQSKPEDQIMLSGKVPWHGGSYQTRPRLCWSELPGPWIVLAGARAPFMLFVWRTHVIDYGLDDTGILSRVFISKHVAKGKGDSCTGRRLSTQKRTLYFALRAGTGTTD